MAGLEVSQFFSPMQGSLTKLALTTEAREHGDSMRALSDISVLSVSPW